MKKRLQISNNGGYCNIRTTIKRELWLGTNIHFEAKMGIEKMAKILL